jgi:hypothetical protein
VQCQPNATSCLPNAGSLACRTLVLLPAERWFSCLSEGFEGRLVTVPKRHFTLEGIKPHGSKVEGKGVEFFKIKLCAQSLFRSFTTIHPEALANFVRDCLSWPTKISIDFTSGRNLIK